MSVKSTRVGLLPMINDGGDGRSRRTRRLGGDGVGLGCDGVAIRVEQAKVRAEEGLRDYTACDSTFVSLVRVGRVREGKGRQRTYCIRRGRFPLA
jgi:hypothetical protein